MNRPLLAPLGLGLATLFGAAGTLAQPTAPAAASGPSLSASVAPALTGAVAPALTGAVAPALTGAVAPALTGAVAPALTGAVAPALTGAVAPPQSPATSPPGALVRPGPKPASTGFAPDPAPLVTRRKWLYAIYHQDGAFFVPTPTLVERPKPTGSPRTMGRFALELYVGGALLERVRFDIPMLSGETPPDKRSLFAPPDLERRARVKVVIEMPDSDRATYALLVDRATGKRQRVFWVPTDGLPRGGPPPSAPPRSAAAPAASSAAP